MYPYGNNMYNNTSYTDPYVGQSAPQSNLYGSNPYGNTVGTNLNVSPFLNNNPYGTPSTTQYPNLNSNPYGTLTTTPSYGTLPTTTQYPNLNNPYGTLTTTPSYGTLPTTTQYPNLNNPYGTLTTTPSYGTLPTTTVNTGMTTNQYGTPIPTTYGVSNTYGTSSPTTQLNTGMTTSLPNTGLNTNPYGLPPTGVTGLPNTQLNTGMTSTNTLMGLPPTGLTNTTLPNSLSGLPPNTGVTGLPNTQLNTGMTTTLPNTGLNTNPYGLPSTVITNPNLLTVQPTPQPLNEEIQRKLKESEEQKLLLEKLQKEKEEMEKKRQQELLEQQMRSQQEKQKYEEQIRQIKLEQERLEKEKREKEMENQRLLEEQKRQEEENRLKLETEKRRILLENRKKQEEMDLRLQQTLQEKDLEQQRMMQMVAQKMKEEERLNLEKEKQELVKNFQQQLSLKDQEQQRLLDEQQKLLIQQNESQKQSWEIEDVSNILFETKIGQGQFGEVWKGKLYGKEVAIKKLLIQKLDEQNLQDFRKELNLMSHLRHPNLLMLMAACTTPGNMLIITPFVHRGSLDHIIHSETPLSLRMRIKICKDIAVGMCWLHNQKPPIIHRDLKPANILVDLNWSGIVSDFGLCQIKSINGEFTGSPYYMSPELLLGKMKTPTPEIDIYAFGITLWEVFTRQKLYDGEFEGWEELTDGVALNGIRPDLPKDIHPFLKKLMEDCWDDDLQKRPNFNMLVNSNILDQIMVDYCISEPTASHFWKSCFINRTPNDAINWMEFVQAFGGSFQIDWKGNEIKGKPFE